MKTSLLTTGPYVEMLCDGMFLPSKQLDGSFLWANPASKTIIAESDNVLNLPR